MESNSGPESNTAVGDVVCVVVDSGSAHGVNLVADASGLGAIVESWDRASGGKFGVVQRHGGVHLGNYLFAINDNQMSSVPFSEVLSVLNDRNILKKYLKFMSSSEYHRRKRVTDLGKSGVSLKESNRNFLSIIRRARVSHCPENKSTFFTEYEIVCQMRLLADTLAEKEIVYKWSVWKRFSEFVILHKAIVKSLGWLMKSTHLPPSKTFTYDKTSAEFIEKRREELNTYWQQVILIDQVTDFKKHHCSQEIKAFLDVNLIVKPSESVGSEIPKERGNSSSGGRHHQQSQSLSLMRRTSGGRRMQSTLSGGTDGESRGIAGHAYSTPTPTAPLNAALPRTPPPPPPPPSLPAPACRPAPPLPASGSSCSSRSPVLAAGPAAAVGNKPPNSGARLNLLSSIQSLRKHDA